LAAETIFIDLVILEIFVVPTIRAFTADAQNKGEIRKRWYILLLQKNHSIDNCELTLCFCRHTARGNAANNAGVPEEKKGKGQPKSREAF
jgi:hypothetical protein